MHPFEQERLDWIEDRFWVHDPYQLYAIVRDRVTFIEREDFKLNGRFVKHLQEELPEDLIIECAQQNPSFCQALGPALKIGFFNQDLRMVFLNGRWVFDYPDWFLARGCLTLARKLELRCLAPDISYWFTRNLKRLERKEFGLKILCRMALETLSTLTPQTQTSHHVSL